MKKYFFSSFLLLIVSSVGANELSWVDEQVKAIKPARSGIGSSNITVLKDPFIFLEKNKSVKIEDKKSSIQTASNNTVSSSTASADTLNSKKLKKEAQSTIALNAIINSSALINNKWYKLHDKVQSYTITNISRKSVVLTRGNKNIVLSTNTKNSNLKFKNE
ncbi:hypothetical protein KJ877_07900 [bacterium]|nr:hypothetical protein [bacterium]MBU1990929.1 hypothetical protein [bacterium]